MSQEWGNKMSVVEVHAESLNYISGNVRDHYYFDIFDSYLRKTLKIIVEKNWKILSVEIEDIDYYEDDWNNSTYALHRVIVILESKEIVSDFSKIVINKKIKKSILSFRFNVESDKRKDQGKT